MNKTIKLMESQLPKLTRSEVSALSCNHRKCINVCVKNFIKSVRAKHSTCDLILNKCNSCKKTYSSKYYLITHSKHCGISQRFKHSSELFSCAHCSYKCSEKKDITLHIQTKHLLRDKLKCEKCEKSFSSYSNLASHLEVCGKVPHLKLLYRPQRSSFNRSVHKFHGKPTISYRIQTKHLSCDSNSYKCNNHEKNFSDPQVNFPKSGIPSNTKFSSKPKQFSCSHCCYSSRYKHNLVEHIKTKHLFQLIHDGPLTRKLKLNKCEKCQKYFLGKKKLQKHLKLCEIPMNGKLSSETWRFFCDHCSFKSNKKNFLAEHIQVEHLPTDITFDKYSDSRKIFSPQTYLSRHLKVSGRSSLFSSELSNVEGLVPPKVFHGSKLVDFDYVSKVINIDPLNDYENLESADFDYLDYLEIMNVNQVLKYNF